MFFKHARRSAEVPSDAMPGGSLPIFFDPTSKRKRLLKALGTFLLLGFLIWSFGFGLSLYALAKLSQIGAAASAAATQSAPEADLDAAPAESTPVTTAIPGGTPVYAYLPYDPEWSAVPLAKALPTIDVLLPEWYRLDPATAQAEPLGFAAPHQRAVAALLGGNGSPALMPVVDTIDGTNDAAIAAALASAETSRRIAQSLVEVASTGKYSGLCLDFSGIADTAYGDIARLFAALQEQFQGTGRTTCLVSSIDSAIWDYAPLKHVVDRALVLGFQDAFGMTQPGPLAAQDWFSGKTGALLKSWDPAKVVIALGATGYDWTPGAPHPKEVGYAEAMRRAGLQDATVGFDKASRNTTFGYFDAEFSDADGGIAVSGGGLRHTVWLLDAASVYNQLLALADQRPGGLAVWPLTGADPAIWTLLKRPLPIADAPALLRNVSIADYVGYEGTGAFQELLRTPQRGTRSIVTDPASGMIVDAGYSRVPEPYSIMRYGAGEKGMIALTFDDGPDPRYTSQILRILAAQKVPATFFVVGSNALRDPALIAAMADAGHEIGVHTFFHPALERVPAWRVRFEVNATERLIASLTGHLTRIFRSPYGRSDGPLTSAEEVPMRQIAEYGYIVVGSDVTPPDWTHASAEALVSLVHNSLNRNAGNVIELHDAGGDRSATVAALPRIIGTLREEGYSFVPLSAFLGRSRSDLMPVDNSLVAAFDAVSFSAIRLAGVLFLAMFWTVMILGIGRAILIVTLAHLRRHHAVTPLAVTPPVTVVIPAFCEEPVIARTIAAVLASDYPALRVLVVDDGSTDRTAGAATAAGGVDSRVTLISQPNEGKFSALNHAYGLVKTDIVVGIDADTIVAPDAIGMLVRHFQDPTVGAVAGNVKVGNRHSLLGKLQALEYITAQNIDRRAADMMNGILVVPGAFGAWRRDAVAKAGNYSSQTLTEDADLTVSVIRAGYRAVFEEAALARTEAPETIRQFMRQRLRWTLGMIQTAWKHRGAFAERHWIGLYAIPELLLFSVIMAVFAPIADLTFAATLVNVAIDAVVLPENAWSAPSLVIVAGYAVFLSADATVAALAFRLEPAEDKRLLLLLPLQRFFYRQLLYVSALRAIGAALSGRLMRWQKITRSPGGDSRPEGTARARLRQIQLTQG